MSFANVHNNDTPLLLESFRNQDNDNLQVQAVGSASKVRILLREKII